MIFRQCRTCKKEKPLGEFHKASKKYYRSDCKDCIPRKTRTENWIAHLRVRYGISPEQYTQMLRDQDWCCGICYKHLFTLKDGLFHVDHDHCTGEVRGLLCKPCNVGLGWFRDNRKALLEASEYLLQDSRSGQK